MQVSDGGTEKRYTYSAQGELLWLHENPPAREYSFEYSIAGLISRLFEGGTATDLQYDPHGNVVGVYFSDGVAVRMEYDVLGLRRKLEFSDGRRFEYSYDPAGNLVGIELIRWDGFRDGQTLELDSDYQVRRQHLADGRIVELQYDRNGNLIEKRFGSSVTRFEYDELDRLTAVVEPDGRRLTYRYAPGEPSLITQLDSETGPISLDRRDRGLTFATQGEISWTRSQPAMYGTVTFAEALGRFQLAGIGGEEIAVAALNADAAVRKLRLVDANRLLAERPREFLAPSNLFFLPREYATINCCPICPFDPSEPQCDPCYMDPPPPDTEPIPSITTIRPTQGIVGTTASVTIEGNSFTDNATVNAGSGISLTYDSRTTTEIKARFAIASNATTGNRLVTVTTAGGTSNPVDFQIVSGCGDQRDQIRQEYIDRLLLVPVCSDFTQSRSSAHFSFAEMNGGDYMWAIIQQRLLTRLEDTRSFVGNLPIFVISGYRNPVRNEQVQGGSNSRHMYGDAADSCASDYNDDGLVNSADRDILAAEGQRAGFNQVQLKVTCVHLGIL